MTNDLVFNSFDDPIPPFRDDLQLIPIDHNGKRVLYVYDVMGYVPSEFALNPQIESFLPFINGDFSIRNITEASQGDINQHELQNFIRFMDRNCLLRSPYLLHVANQKEEEYETEARRPPALAGHSYPERSSELQIYLDDIFSVSSDKQSRAPVKALYAPHIDPQIGRSTYSNAFSLLRKTCPDRVVILATAHYAGFYPEIYEHSPFIGSNKKYELPGGSLETDRDYINKLKSSRGTTGFTLQDRAHRIEHSIELHLLFARYIWRHDFSIVPILVNAFDELFYMSDGHLGSQLDQFSMKLRELDDENTFYLISGDLAHVGKKFGDKLPADRMKEEVELFDQEFIKNAASNRKNDLMRQISRKHDRYRICGFPPLYTFLKAFPSLKGEQVDYQWWDESERESAVSFGAISY